MGFLKEAGDSVREKTISNCWRKTGILPADTLGIQTKGKRRKCCLTSIFAKSIGRVLV